MTKGQDYQQRKNFITNTVADLLAVKKDFDYIKYAKQSITGAEYIRIGDVRGSAVTIDVTAKSLEEIVNDVARVILIGSEKVTPPVGIITDAIELRSLAPLFK